MLFSLVSCQVEGLSKSATLTSLSNYNRKAVTDRDYQLPSPTEHLKVSHPISIREGLVNRQIEALASVILKTP